MGESHTVSQKFVLKLAPSHAVISQILPNQLGYVSEVLAFISAVALETECGLGLNP